MYLNNKIVIGKNSETESCIIPKLINRHGLITGATGSGKTTTVKVLAESFADAGIPVFMIDVKGDLSGTCKEGTESAFINQRITELALENFEYKKYSVNFFDVYKKNGLPIRTTVTDVGPKILTKMLDLNDTQEGILTIAFQVSKDEALELINLNDLRQLLTYIGENKDKYILEYGNITVQSIATIQRKILELTQEGGDNFFGEPKLDLYDLMQYDFNGKGFINILDAQILYKSPNLYASVLVWLLTSLYNNMPEVGDLDRPKLALFLDEAHLIFSEMNDELTKKIIQTIKLIRSKGIGVYFISQSPTDIPEEILGQLGNKIQHVLRGYTPKDEKSIRAAAESFRPNPEFDTANTIKELATGEALVSFLNENGEPSIVERTFILPPQSYTSSITDEERIQVIQSSRFYGKYIADVNSHSAEEKVVEKRIQKEEEQARLIKEQELAKQAEKERIQKEKEEAKRQKEQNKFARKIGNKVVDKATTKIVNTIWKNLFK